MGWTVLYRSNSPKNYAEEKKVIQELFQPEEKFEIVQMSKNGSVWYVACRMKQVEGQPVFATIIKTSMKNGEFGYKDMDETMHPYYYGAPLSLINKLTPTDNARANEWRNKVRQRHAEEKKLRASNVLTNGMKVNVDGMFDKYNGKDITELTVHDIENRKFYWNEGGVIFTLQHKQVKQIKIKVLEEQQKVEG